MSKAIDLLVYEHRIILGLISQLEGLVSSPPSTGARQELREIATLMVDFADRRHHAKEESILFEVMLEAGFSREFGPISVMLQEHDLGRKQIRELLAIGAGTGNVELEEWNLARGYARVFAEMLKAHIMKEDTVLYPMALQVLRPERVEELDQRVAEFEASQPTLDLMSPRLAELARQVPEGSCAVASGGGGCFGCSGH